MVRRTFFPVSPSPESCLIFSFLLICSPSLHVHITKHSRRHEMCAFQNICQQQQQQREVWVREKKRKQKLLRLTWPDLPEGEDHVDIIKCSLHVCLFLPKLIDIILLTSLVSSLNISWVCKPACSLFISIAFSQFNNPLPIFLGSFLKLLTRHIRLAVTHLVTSVTR